MFSINRNIQPAHIIINTWICMSLFVKIRVNRETLYEHPNCNGILYLDVK